jgi:hypothetical protein
MKEEESVAPPTFKIRDAGAKPAILSRRCVNDYTSA